MLKIGELITKLNALKNRAEFIADHVFLLANEEFQSIKTGTFGQEQDFDKWGIFKFFFKGSNRLTRLLDSIDNIFDLIEKDIEDIIVKSKPSEEAVRDIKIKETTDQEEN